MKYHIFLQCWDRKRAAICWSHRTH